MRDDKPWTRRGPEPLVRGLSAYVASMVAVPTGDKFGDKTRRAVHSVLTMQLLDGGNDDRLVAMATVTLQRHPS